MADRAAGATSPGAGGAFGKVSALLRDLSLSHLLPAFKDQYIDDEELLYLTEDQLRDHLGIPQLGIRQKILRAIQRLAPPPQQPLAAAQSVSPSQEGASNGPDNGGGRVVSIPVELFQTLLTRLQIPPHDARSNELEGKAALPASFFAPRAVVSPPSPPSPPSPLSSHPPSPEDSLLAPDDDDLQEPDAKEQDVLDYARHELQKFEFSDRDSVDHVELEPSQENDGNAAEAKERQGDGAALRESTGTAQLNASLAIRRAASQCIEILQLCTGGKLVINFRLQSEGNEGEEASEDFISIHGPEPLVDQASHVIENFILTQWTNGVGNVSAEKPAQPAVPALATGGLGLASTATLTPSSISIPLEALFGQNGDSKTIPAPGGDEDGPVALTLPRAVRTALAEELALLPDLPPGLVNLEVASPHSNKIQLPRRLHALVAPLLPDIQKKLDKERSLVIPPVPPGHSVRIQAEYKLRYGLSRLALPAFQDKRLAIDLKLNYPDDKAVATSCVCVYSVASDLVRQAEAELRHQILHRLQPATVAPDLAAATLASASSAAVAAPSSAPGGTSTKSSSRPLLSLFAPTPEVTPIFDPELDMPPEEDSEFWDGEASPALPSPAPHPSHGTQPAATAPPAASTRDWMHSSAKPSGPELPIPSARPSVDPPAPAPAKRDASPPKRGYLRMRGIPWEATTAEVFAFFASIRPIALYFWTDDQGDITGDAFAEFTDHSTAQQALAKYNRKNLRQRYIELWQWTTADFHRARANYHLIREVAPVSTGPQALPSPTPPRANPLTSTAPQVRSHGSSVAPQSTAGSLSNNAGSNSSGGSAKAPGPSNSSQSSGPSFSVTSGQSSSGYSPFSGPSSGLSTSGPSSGYSPFSGPSSGSSSGFSPFSGPSTSSSFGSSSSQSGPYSSGQFPVGSKLTGLGGGPLSGIEAFLGGLPGNAFNGGEVAALGSFATSLFSAYQGAADALGGLGFDEPEALPIAPPPKPTPKPTAPVTPKAPTALGGLPDPVEVSRSSWRFDYPLAIRTEVSRRYATPLPRVSVDFNLSPDADELRGYILVSSSDPPSLSRAQNFIKQLATQSLIDLRSKALRSAFTTSSTAAPSPPPPPPPGSDQEYDEDPITSWNVEAPYEARAALEAQKLVFPSRVVVDWNLTTRDSKFIRLTGPSSKIKQAKKIIYKRVNFYNASRPATVHTVPAVLTTDPLLIHPSDPSEAPLPADAQSLAMLTAGHASAGTNPSGPSIGSSGQGRAPPAGVGPRVVHNIKSPYPERLQLSQIFSFPHKSVTIAWNLDRNTKAYQAQQVSIYGPLNDVVAVKQSLLLLREQLLK